MSPLYWIHKSRVNHRNLNSRKSQLFEKASPLGCRTVDGPGCTLIKQISPLPRPHRRPPASPLPGARTTRLGAPGLVGPTVQVWLTGCTSGDHLLQHRVHPTQQRSSVRGRGDRRPCSVKHWSRQCRADRRVGTRAVLMHQVAPRITLISSQWDGQRKM